MKENKTITAYKGFDKNLKCRGFQYELGKEYEMEDPIEVCSRGFHACESPLEVLDHYFFEANGHMARFCEVEQSGSIDKEINTTKIASSKIKIKAEVSFSDFIKLGVEWLKEKTSPSNLSNSDNTGEKIGSSGDSAKIGSSGDSAQIGSSGDSAQIGSSGDYAQIGSSGDSAQIGSSGDSAKIGSSGDYAQIGSSGHSAQIGSSGHYAKIGSSGDSAKIDSSGHYAKIGSSGDSAKIGSSGHSAKIGSSGDSAQIGSSGDSAKIGSSGDSAKIGSSGHYAQIYSTGEDSVVCCAGQGSIAKAKKGSWITLAEWTFSYEKRRYVPKCVKTEFVDGDHIKADTFYKLENGNFKEV